MSQLTALISFLVLTASAALAQAPAPSPYASELGRLVGLRHLEEHWLYRRRYGRCYSHGHYQGS
jgi:hypothetical protein